MSRPLIDVDKIPIDEVARRPGRIPWVRVALGLIVSLALLWLALRQVDLSDLATTIANVNYLYLIGATCVYFVDIAVRAVRWRVLLSGTASISARRLYPVLAIGYMANNLLPVRIGELSRAYLVGKREGVSASAVLASVAVERIADGLTVVVLLLAMLPMLPSTVGANESWVSALAYIALATFGLGSLVIAILVVGRRFWIELARTALARLPESTRAKAMRLLRGFLDGLDALRNPRRLAEIAALSIVVWVVGAATYLLVAAAFGVAMTPFAAVTCICVVNLATAVPLAPAGLGAFEAVAVRMFVLLGITTTTALGMTILLHAVLFFPVVVVGLIFLWRTGFTFGHLWRRSDGRDVAVAGEGS